MIFIFGEFHRRSFTGVLWLKKKPCSLHYRAILKTGSYLLSHHYGSTIGVKGLNFSVRNGKRWVPLAIATI